MRSAFNFQLAHYYSYARRLVVWWSCDRSTMSQGLLKRVFKTHGGRLRSGRFRWTSLVGSRAQRSEPCGSRSGRGAMNGHFELGSGSDPFNVTICKKSNTDISDNFSRSPTSPQINFQILYAVWPARRNLKCIQYICINDGKCSYQLLLEIEAGSRDQLRNAAVR